MKTNFEKLKFAAEFVRMDLENILPVKRAELRDKLIQFSGLEIGPPLEAGKEAPTTRGTKQAAKIMYLPSFPGDTLIATVTPKTHLIVSLPTLHSELVPVDHLKGLKKMFSNVLDRFVDWDKNRSSAVPAFAKDINVSYGITTIANRLIEEAYFLSENHQKNLEDGMFLVLAHLLGNTKAYIRRCPAAISTREKNKVCGAIFVSKDKRKVYCTNTCATRIRMIESRNKETPEARTIKYKERLVREVTSTKKRPALKK